MLLPLLLGLTSGTFTAHAESTAYLGLSGYPTSTSQLQTIINTMKANGMNTYRMVFTPQWFGGSQSNVYTYVNYYLTNTPSDWYIVVDRNHLYPPTEYSASLARSNWSTVRSNIFNTLSTWKNNPRVVVELINEYVSSDFYSRMQTLVNDVRSAGYTNKLVFNRWWTISWKVVSDPIGQTYQGFHAYFDCCTLSNVESSMKTAQSMGIKLLNTEVGADCREAEYYSYTQVQTLNSFLSWSYSQDIGNLIWVNGDLWNWQTYKNLGLTLPKVSATPVSSPSISSNTQFQDGFESNSLSGWSSTTASSGDYVKTANYVPYSGSCHTRFYTSGSSWERENAFVSKSVNLQSISASGYFYFSSYLSRTILNDNGDKTYLIRLSSSNGDIAWAGMIRENGIYKWLLYTNGALTSSAVSISTDQYYGVKLYWNAAQRTAELFVNGAKILQSSTGSYSAVTRVDMGIIYTSSVQNPLIVYGDSFNISTP